MPDILPLLQCLQPVLSKTQCRQLARIVLAMLAMTGRITQRNIARWTQQGGRYRSVQRFFQTSVPWLEIKWRFFECFLYRVQDTYLLVGDETVCAKAGKKTFGLDRFFSSVLGKPIPGVAFFGFCLVSVQQRHAYPLCAEQVVRTPQEKEQAQQRKHKRSAKPKTDTHKKKPGRPKGSKNKNKAEKTLSPELQRILGWAEPVLARLQQKMQVRYLVLDGHFGNASACQMTRQLGLHLISKMRHDAALFLPPTQEQKQTQPRLKYADQLDYAALPAACLVRSQVEDEVLTQVYQLSCWHKEFAELLNIVILQKTDLRTNRVGHVVLFSSDLSLDALMLWDYYALRFQIEFIFREAKQHFGLDEFMGVTQTSVANAVGLSLLLCNVSSALLLPLRQMVPNAGINDLKSYYRGRRYVEETLKCLPVFPEPLVWERVLAQVALLGFIHTPSQAEKTGAGEAEIGFSPPESGMAIAA